VTLLAIMDDFLELYVITMMISLPGIMLLLSMASEERDNKRSRKRDDDGH